MNKAILGILLASGFLSGCLAVGAAGAVVGATGAVVGGGVDLVTTSQDEKNAKGARKYREAEKQRKAEEKGSRNRDD